MSIKPTYITDDAGTKLSVILSMSEFISIINELEDVEDIKLYDEAKKEDDGQRILLSEYRKQRQFRNGLLYPIKNVI
jgi:hypothetical protein